MNKLIKLLGAFGLSVLLQNVLEAAVSVPVINNTKYPIAVMVYPGTLGLLPSTARKSFNVPQFFEDSLINRIEAALAEFIAKKKIGPGMGEIAGQAIKQAKGCFRSKGITGAAWSSSFCKSVQAMDVKLIPANSTMNMDFWELGLFRNYVQAYQFKTTGGRLIFVEPFQVFYSSRSIVTTSAPASVEFSDGDFAVGEGFACIYASGYDKVKQCLGAK